MKSEERILLYSEKWAAKRWEESYLLVQQQAESEALWATARTPMEAMLQEALRALHGTVDGPTVSREELQ